MQWCLTAGRGDGREGVVCGPSSCSERRHGRLPARRAGEQPVPFGARGLRGGALPRPQAHPVPQLQTHPPPASAAPTPCVCSSSALFCPDSLTASQSEPHISWFEESPFEKPFDRVAGHSGDYHALHSGHCVGHCQQQTSHPAPQECSLDMHQTRLTWCPGSSPVAIVSVLSPRHVLLT